jgi:hypothetical protein
MNRLIVVTVLGAVALVAGGTAWAVIPDSDGTFHACVNQATGLVRVIDPDRSGSLGRCISSGPALLRETPVKWNQTGPAGPQGPPGQPGAGSDVYVAFGGGVNLDETDYVLRMDLPAGAFVVTTSFQLDNDRLDQTFANQPLVTCRVGRAAAQPPSSEVRQSVPPARGVELVTGSFTFEVAEPWTLELRCPRVTSGHVLFMSNAALQAQTVGRIIAR